MNILLAYEAFPIITAIYFENALKKTHNVITVGIVPTKDFNKSNNTDLESRRLDIETGITPDINEVLKYLPEGFGPNLFLFIESIGSFLPQNLETLNCPKACYLIDSHLNLEKHFELAKQFDYTFLAQAEYVSEFRNKGIKNVFWLPLGCDPDYHKEFNEDKEYDLSFVGSTKQNPRRLELLKKLSTKLNVLNSRAFFDDMCKNFAKGKIAFNSSVKRDLNMRVFEVLSMNQFLLTDMAENSNQEKLFIQNEDLAVYKDNQILDVTDFYLKNDKLRNAIKERGHKIIRKAHKYSDRTNSLIDVVKGVKKQTPTAEEWRELSTKNIEPTSAQVNRLKRSFVIPVLDYSPNSNYNIKTLLDDLTDIEGNVIIIFNSEKVAEQLKNHPRIDNYAIMKKNVGVARAWNIGVEISDTPITFIMNSDLKVGKSAVIAIEDTLINYSTAAMAGPQGCYNYFPKLDDHHYFEKGTFNHHIDVDAVSGFFFAVRTKLFHDGVLKFETAFSPCYFEEWDIGLQIKQKGLKSIIVPTTDYDHIWGGTIESLKTVKFLDEELTLSDIKRKNTLFYLQKWVDINEASGEYSELLVSKWAIEKFKYIQQLLDKNNIKEAFEEAKDLVEKYPGFKWGYFILGKVSQQGGDKESAKKLYEIAIKLDDKFEDAKKSLKKL